jgi:hypothetical protein
MGQCKSEGKNFKRDYAKAKLRENMGQSKSKERLKRTEEKRKLAPVQKVGFIFNVCMIPR